MKKSKSSGKSADWTQLLADPDLVSHLPTLLQICRETTPELREQALFEAIRGIKNGTAPTVVATEPEPETETEIEIEKYTTQAPENQPPFEPDIFTPSWGQDRRRYPRVKCFVAVELRVEGSDAPIWGNLANTSTGGCLVDAPQPLPPGAKLEMGLWVADGKIWVKGVTLSGVVTKSNPSFGVRVKFAHLEPVERESLRKFLKFVESSTKGYEHEHGYLAQLKR
jgi:hypothetical protein